MIKIAIITAALTQGTGALGSQTLTCSEWQGIRTCSSHRRLREP